MSSEAEWLGPMGEYPVLPFEAKLKRELDSLREQATRIQELETALAEVVHERDALKAHFDRTAPEGGTVLHPDRDVVRTEVV